MNASVWIGIVSERLQRQWPSVEPARLDDLAADLWTDEKLRAMEPAVAADEWLRPVATRSSLGGESRAASREAREARGGVPGRDAATPAGG